MSGLKAGGVRIKNTRRERKSRMSSRKWRAQRVRGRMGTSVNINVDAPEEMPPRVPSKLRVAAVPRARRPQRAVDALDGVAMRREVVRADARVREERPAPPLAGDVQHGPIEAQRLAEVGARAEEIAPAMGRGRTRVRYAGM